MPTTFFPILSSNIWLKFYEIDIGLRNRVCFYAIFLSLIRSTAASATLQTKENQTERKVFFHIESCINVPKK